MSSVKAGLPLTEFRHRTLSLAVALLLAILIFLFIPITQRIRDQPENTIELRKIVIVQPPPPPNIQPDPIIEQIPDNTLPKPAFKKQITKLSPRPIERPLNPGINEVLAMGLANNDLNIDIDATGDIQNLFTFDDLAQSPRIINQPRIQYPAELIRRGIREGRVIVSIEIDEDGRAKIIQVLSATHPQLIQPAKDVIRQARFTKPLVNTVAQKVRGEWPIVLRAP